MAVVGISALIYRGRRPGGTRLRADAQVLDRDLVFFGLFFAAGLGLGLGMPDAVQIPCAVGFVFAYGVYVRRTLRGGGAVQEVDTLQPLLLDWTPGDEPGNGAIAVQFLVGLGAMVGGAHLFVEELVTVSEQLGTEPLVLSLILAPLATELPEKANSFFWVRQGKDSLALGNITGAMVFQSTIPIAFGLAFAEWDLDHYAVVAGALGLAGGGVAYWALRLRGRFEPLSIVIWAALFAAFIVYVVAA
jgi:cation:H+ antiporter